MSLLHGGLLTPDEQRALLALARSSVEAAVRRWPPPEPACHGGLGLPFGAFVTLTRGGALRGCLGRIESRQPLAVTVAAIACDVCTGDPRFTPVEASELEELTIEISVLQPPRRISRPDEIEIGRHGLIVEQGRRQGLLLPQVAIAHGWDVETFLAHTCVKAGLPHEGWRQGARVYVFEADVFDET